MLKEHGAKLTIPEPEMATMLCAAVANNNMEQLMLLLAVGAPVDAKYNLSGTALHVAAERGNAEAARILVKDWSADVSVRDCHGWTPLDIARRQQDGGAPAAALIELLEQAASSPPQPSAAAERQGSAEQQAAGAVDARGSHPVLHSPTGSDQELEVSVSDVEVSCDAPGAEVSRGIASPS